MSETSSASPAVANRHSPQFEQRQGILFAALATFFLSTSPILARWANLTLSSSEITAGRFLIGGLTILAFAFLKRQRFPPPAEWPKFSGFGLITTLHFLSYTASLEYTTIAHSLAIVYTAPIFVAFFSWLVLGERLTSRKWLGTLVVVAGVAILAGFEPSINRRMLFGDLLALCSALTFGLYSVAGRSQRNRYDLFVYAGVVYSLAALWTLPVAAATFRPSGYTVNAVASIAGLGLLPLAIGHTLYNAALRRVNATVVNLIATQEITGGILLGIWFLGEYPSVNTLIGVVVTLIGILMTL